MKLSEALSMRKQLNQKIEALWQRFHANLKRQEDETEVDENPVVLLQTINSTIAELESVVVTINQVNNRVTIQAGDAGEVFQGTIMQAIARREALNRKMKGLDSAIGSLSYRHRRSKDELKEIPMIPLAELRGRRDALAADYRKLDAALQTANWNTEV